MNKTNKAEAAHNMNNDELQRNERLRRAGGNEVWIRALRQAERNRGSA